MTMEDQVSEFGRQRSTEAPGDVLPLADVGNRVANSIYWHSGDATLGFIPLPDSVETVLAAPNTLCG
jgi:hypothetical protein